MEQRLECKVCGAEVNDYLGDHLLEVHSLTVPAYLAQHPLARTVSDRLWKQFQASTAGKPRANPPDPDKLTITLKGIEFPVNTDVPPEACLPLPEFYRLPQFGKLGADICHALISLYWRRSCYIWGMPGTGKDALFHAFSALTRTPAMIRQVKPGTDIESWFFSRSFNKEGTYWEEGEVLKALRDGYRTPTGKVVPYMILFTDFDRSDRDQAEHVRLIGDSIQGRIDGPAGMVYPVLPGTLLVGTGNTSGGGDTRNRMVSANPLDASLMDRWKRVLQFHDMDWKDEGEIVKAKFPLLFQKDPTIFANMGSVTKKLREAINDETLHAEFSHRALCNILEHAEDMLRLSGGKLPEGLLNMAVRVWLERLPDQENQDLANGIMDPYLGTKAVGDISHIGTGDLASAVGVKNA